MQELVGSDTIISLDLFSRVSSSDLPLDDIKLDALNLSTRSYNALKRGGIDSIGELVRLSQSDLARMQGIGAKSHGEIVGNTHDYLERMTKLGQAERLLTTSVLELVGARRLSMISATPASSVNGNLDRQVLVPVPLEEIVAEGCLLDLLASLGLSSSLDIWVLAFGHHLKLDAVFGQALDGISMALPGRWHAQAMMDFHTSIEKTATSHFGLNAWSTSNMASVRSSLSGAFRVELVMKSSPSSKVHWEAFLPDQCLRQRIDWFRHYDKTTGLCAFLRQIAGNSAAHWAHPPVENWGRLPRARPVDAFYYWLSLLEERFSDRDRKIFRRRFGLVSGQRSTLQEVGGEHNITRERVRQIVRRCLRSLLHPARMKYLAPFVYHFDALFERHGGIMTLNEIVRSSVCVREFEGTSSLQAAELLLMGGNKYDALDHRPAYDNLGNKALSGVTWHINTINPGEIARVRETAKRLVAAYPLKYDSEELVEIVSSSINSVDREVVRASLRTCQELRGPASGHGPLISRQARLTTYEMAAIALRELLVPASHRAIHKKMCEIFPDRHIDTRTLRNVLSSDRFRMVDRGIYALR